jgi:hypothetical protein
MKKLELLKTILQNKLLLKSNKSLKTFTHFKLTPKNLCSTISNTIHSTKEARTWNLYKFQPKDFTTLIKWLKIIGKTLSKTG